MSDTWFNAGVHRLRAGIRNSRFLPNAGGVSRKVQWGAEAAKDWETLFRESPIIPRVK